MSAMHKSYHVTPLPGYALTSMCYKEEKLFFSKLITQVQAERDELLSATPKDRARIAGNLMMTRSLAQLAPQRHIQKLVGLSHTNLLDFNVPAYTVYALITLERGGIYVGKTCRPLVQRYLDHISLARACRNVKGEKQNQCTQPWQQ